MLRICTSVLLFALLAITGFAQNLVPNPSFETYTGCPAGNSAISNGFVASWNRPPGSIITPDLFTPCTTAGVSCLDFNTANNCVGSSAAFQGTAYAGFLWYYTAGGGLKEYIQAQLTSLCVSGTVYRASYRTKLGSLCRYGTNRLGLYISANAIAQAGNAPITIVPTVERPGQVLDKVNWTPVSGTFISNGTERYITIGNFYSDANTSIFNFGASAGTCIFATGAAYYMIDSVVVRPAVILPVSINEFHGEARPNGNQLQWEVRPATELSELWLEHSTDGEHFSMIQQWLQPDDSQLNAAYLHDSPAESLNFYRLGMTDRNGEFMVSEIVALRQGHPEKIRLQLQPNPADDHSILGFQLPESAEGYSVHVRTLNGTEVSTENVTENPLVAAHRLSTADLPAGMYIVEVKSGGRSGNSRLAVVH
ncbi:MAG: hypothetical protein RLZZ519_3035 [Bacteroidota bacterium]|jgi:hypothetical protein